MTFSRPRPVAWLCWLKPLLRVPCVVIAVAGLNGCASNSLYDWGHYEDSLYDRYVKEDLTHGEAYAQETITDTERNQGRVPPGVYADYGFLLYRRGDKTGAVAYFEKEKHAFPESTALMAKLIERVRKQESTQDTPTSQDAGQQEVHP